ncbi:putative cytochrome p450 [Diplodia seriata]|uniref:Putative cytochrome p450 n=1 Tax=Diplodia seriata TaxID=420778 RepID=A0A0G2GZB8_9PEZI|nr:putative cytochrome p450 [Diplodia seriata]
MAQAWFPEQSVLSLLLRGVVTLYILHFLGRTFYGVFLSPLAKYPGPKLNAATAIPFWYNTLRGDQTTWIQRLHTQYGPVVRLSPARLSYITAQAWKDIYGHRTTTIKDPKFYSPPINGVHSLVTEPSNDAHGQMRKIFSHAFSHKALVEQEALIGSYADLLVRKTRGDIIATTTKDKRFDLVKLFNFTTFDIMADLTFGEPLHQLDTSRYAPWVAAIFGGFKASDMARVTLEYPLLRRVWNAAMPRRLLAMRREHFQHAVDRVEARLAASPTSTKKADIWELVLRDGGRMDAAQMHSNAALFMLAGTETTATLLSGLVFRLLRNPRAMQALVGEIRGAFAAEADMGLVNLQRLRYLDAQFAAYRSPLNFRDPESFIPERWMDGTGYETDSKEVLQPFSFGPRNCLGKK